LIRTPRSPCSARGVHCPKRDGGCQHELHQSPPPSRGGLGGDGVARAVMISRKHHPHPGLPLEGEGEKHVNRDRAPLAFQHPIPTCPKNPPHGANAG
jgi:hypothetical protein